MKSNQTDAELRRLFAEGAREEVSPVFTTQLIDTLHRERLLKPPSESFMGKWLGKVTIGVALAANALVLSRLDVFTAPPEMIYAVLAFVVGAFAATTLLKNLRAA